MKYRQCSCSEHGLSKKEIRPISAHGKMISDKHVTRICDAMKKTAAKQLERFKRLRDPHNKQLQLCCMISCICIVYAHNGC